jgi:hypothetical protein
VKAIFFVIVVVMRVQRICVNNSGVILEGKKMIIPYAKRKALLYFGWVVKPPKCCNNWLSGVSVLRTETDLSFPSPGRQPAA